MLIEAELIRLHQPEYNILLKDDKSPIYLVVGKRAFPSVKLVRKKELLASEKKTALGPFSSAYKLKQVLKIARKIFPWCDLAEQRVKKGENNPQKILQTHQRPCFYYHLDLCPGACIGKISEDEYQKNLEQLLLFLKGEKKEVLLQMNKQMKQFADDLQFEKANRVKHKIALIQDVTSRQFRLKPDLILPALHDSASQDALDHLRRILIETGAISRLQKLERIEGYDVSNLMGENATVSMVVFLNGNPEKSEYRLFNIRDLNTPNDYQMMKQAISRRSQHPEWSNPNLILV
ncbi:MAG: Excinuclease ABC subunit C, partial [Microgenomates bacterium 39_7]